jgi:quinol monooxygenase YgiN
MPNEKVVLLLQTKVLPQYRAEILQAARANKLPTRAEPSVEAYYQTARKDDPNTLLFFVVFASQDAHDFHMEKDYAKRTFAAFEGKLAEEPVYTNLSELN